VKTITVKMLVFSFVQFGKKSEFFYPIIWTEEVYTINAPLPCNWIDQIKINDVTFQIIFLFKFAREWRDCSNFVGLLIRE
jgi:hypothetical protein